jgi:hypothetical protein
MPQPLSSFDRKAEFKLAARSTSFGVRNPYFEQHGAIATAAMEAIVEWGFIEFDIVMLFSQLCGGPQQDAFKVYAALKGDGPKAAALLAIIEDKFIDRDKEIFHVVRSWSKVCENKRNQIVHHVWGTIESRTDAVVLVEPMDYFLRTGDLDKSKVMVWTEKDFKDAAQQCRRLSVCYHALSDLKHPEDRDFVFKLLLKIPEIEARLRHLRKRKART